MSKYTFDLRELISTFGENEVKSWFMQYDLAEYLSPEEIQVINNRGVWSKEQLATRIVDHFFLREIGTDAPGSFKLYVRDKMHEVMDTYAYVIYSASIKYDPLVNVDFTEEYDRDTASQAETSSTSTGRGTSLTINSDTPQGNINKEDILKGEYASSTSANENDSLAQDNSSNAGTGTEHYTKRTKGNSGVSATAQAMIRQYRDNIRAINTEIVRELEPLFMALY